MKRILLVDNHEVVRSGVVRIINRPDWEFGEAATGTAALEAVRKKDWDLVVLDLSLGDHSGLDVLREIKQDRPKLPVLILTMHSEVQYLRRALRNGAERYITKNSTREALAEAVRTVMEGGMYTDSGIELQVGPIQQDADAPKHQALSDRELQVMSLLGSGKTVSEIAALLNLSDKTISTYRARILEKMGMRTNAAIIRYAIRNGLAN